MSWALGLHPLRLVEWVTSRLNQARQGYAACAAAWCWRSLSVIRICRFRLVRTTSLMRSSGPEDSGRQVPAGQDCSFRIAVASISHSRPCSRFSEIQTGHCIIVKVLVIMGSHAETCLPVYAHLTVCETIEPPAHGYFCLDPFPWETPAVFSPPNFTLSLVCFLNRSSGRLLWP